MAHEMVFAARDKEAADLAARICRLLQVTARSDAFHTPPALAAALVSAFDGAGCHVALNTPFSGGLVPSQYFGQDGHVTAAMIEVRRDLYLDEAMGVPRDDFGFVARTIRECLLSALQALAK